MSLLSLARCTTLSRFQTNDMQWSYNVQGLLPEYMPPSGHSSVPMARPQPDPLHHKEPINYIVKNKQLLITGVSSPIKGAPLMKINQVKWYIYHIFAASLYLLGCESDYIFVLSSYMFYRWMTYTNRRGNP